MPPSRPGKVNLFKGAVLHIEAYDSRRGFDPKDKFLVVVGRKDASTIVAFLITSQKTYLKSFYARELVSLGAKSNMYLTKESYVLCHHVELLDLAELESGFANGSVSNCGSLRAFLPTIRAVVEDSDVLERREIEEILATLDA